MAERKKSDMSRSVKNSLLTAAEFGFPYENFSTAAVLVPASQNNSSVLLEDVGEVDSFVGQNPPSSSVLPPFSAAPIQSKPGNSSILASELQRSFSPGHNPLVSSDIKPITFFTSQSNTSADPFSFPPSTLPQLYQHSLPHTAPVSEPVSRSFSGRSTPSNYDSRPTSSVPLLSPAQIGQPFTAATVANTNLVYSQVPPAIPVSNSSNSYFKPLSPVPFTSSQGDFLSKPSPLITPSSASSPASHLSPSLITPPPPSNVPPSGITPPPSNVLRPVVTPPPTSVPFSQPSALLTPAPAVTPVPLTSGAPPGSGTNTYRLGNQRKLQYAQPPGLSVSSSPSVYSPATISAPPSTPFSSTFTNSSPVPEPLTEFSSTSFTSSPFVPTPLEELQSLPSITTLSTPSSTSSFHFPPQNSYVSPSTGGNLTNSFSSPAVPPASQHTIPSVASYFPSPIVAAANAMAATVAAANGAPQFQTPSQTPTDASVIPASFNNLSIGQPTYRPVYHHWFLKKEIESKVLWQPFSMADSLALEAAFTSTDISPDTVVATDGGRYDVNILRRQRTAVYWEENPSEVRRCSWFYKGAIDSRYVPYEESVATKLEEEFKIAMNKNEWHRRVELAHGETVVFHGSNVMVHFPQAASPDAWGNTPVTTRPRVVKRGVDEFDIEDGEPPVVDHLLFLVHGVGSACDLKFRTVEEVVDDFRSLSLQLVQSHFRTSVEQGKVNRIEVLPVSWHSTLHGEDTGIDQKLKCITLPSIPKLRHFTNDTLLDILFYTSPVFCQTIIHTVGKEINRLYELFRNRHPNFQGGISVGGHSLGSLILFDLLCHQKDPQTPTTEKESKLQSIPSEDSADPATSDEVTAKDSNTFSAQKVPPHLRRLSHRVSYVMGNAGTGQPFITYPQLNFHPKAFFAMGSPIGMFVTVRGIDALGEDFKLPTCPGFFNIFHPFDPVAYRIETLINPDLCNLKPVMIPHHKGRKRMHLELKETMARVGADLKQKFLDSVRSTWNTVYQIAMFHRSDTNALEQEVDKVIEEQLQHQETESSHSEEPDPDVAVGQLNSGRRVDYVLQEAPLESFNEYLFALGSHVCYWESEDTMLMILKEVYNAMGISADSNVHPTNATYERRHSGSATTPDLPSYQDSLFATPSSSISQFVGENTDNRLDQQTAVVSSESSGKVSPSTPQTVNQSLGVGSSNRPTSLGMDPTAPPSENKNIGPPPISGFMRK
ncbi:hypothetical protein R5R35_014340 [Gryllus longicercus]|uniref:DDHD domain-containing protein n=1 Tax=Gryllus longicercus TaxID=2509291 RepID=A0AAN9Z897_9ORTH